MTNKKYIRDLSLEELEKVFNNSVELDNEVLNDMHEIELLYISEQLEYVKSALSDYSVGDYGKSWATVGNADEFILSMEVMDKSIPLFTDEGSKDIYKALELREKYRNTDMNTAEFDEIAHIMDVKAQELADKMVGEFDSRLNYAYDSKNRLNYFIEFYVANRLDEDCYILIDENGKSDYTLHQDISYTKTY